MATLEIVGRRSCRVISFPLAMVILNDERYLVSMLGANATWVKNVHAAGGHARLRHGRVEQVLLEEIPIEERAPILKAYLRVAPGARPHLPVDMDAPLEEFEKIAAAFPVFRLKANCTESSSRSSNASWIPVDDAPDGTAARNASR